MTILQDFEDRIEREPMRLVLEDGTNEGIRSRNKPFSSIQFHPETSPGPREAGVPFDDFVRHMAALKRN